MADGRLPEPNSKWIWVYPLTAGPLAGFNDLLRYRPQTVLNGIRCKSGPRNQGYGWIHIDAMYLKAKFGTYARCSSRAVPWVQKV